MKITLNQIKIILAVFLTLIGLSALSYDIQFTRTDGTLWQCEVTPPQPENPTLIGTNSPAIGSHTNVYNGSVYTIDAVNNTLIKDGSVVGSLYWNAGGHVWDVQSHFGFTIDKNGVAWLATLDSDADNQSFLLQVDLITGNVTLIDYLGSADLFQINGLIVHHYR